jgi:molybdenum cofactor cytidylyltransferase
MSLNKMRTMSMKSPQIWAVVLAAGESKRMGEPKLLLPLAGRTIIEAVVEQALASRADRIVVVLGAERERIEAQIHRFPVEIAFNPDYQSGMLSSVIRGVATLPGSAQAALILLADQPFITSGVINTVIAAYEKNKKGIVVPVHGGRRGHPLLLDMKYRKDIGRLNPEIGLKELLQKHPGDIHKVFIRNSAVLRDIDNREDYIWARR